jgi:hypothetical protein
MFNADAIQGAIKPAGNNAGFFLSNRFSLHNLFSYMLSLTGPAYVRISTFSLCEAAIRNFVNHAEAGDITGSSVLLDMSLTKRSIDKLLFVSNVLSNIRLMDNHSKLIILNPEPVEGRGVEGLIFLGSANFNDNRKFESGFISSDPQLVATAIECFDDMFNNAMPLVL